MRAKWNVVLGMMLVLVLAFMSAGCPKKAVHQPVDVAAVNAAEAARQAEEARLREEALLRERQLVEERQQARLAELTQQLTATMIHFDFDCFALRLEARTILQRKAELLKNNPDIKLLIEGHCDERGTNEYNLALGERRARATYEFLVLLGVRPNRLQMVSYGEERPLDPASNETAWALNRRAQFKLLGM